ncbi:unnamed protein product [Paramecium primaurelia]|uniref:Rhodanese domain-containing protein n=1 Tax=Paramecium primaurelia TaxID=5886 RepID=A0A8S1KJG2_PARPR|nr:unnamed protein product [Paramecium primaurelia]CAD8054859.1 unnamed protein product [Paramecium primaurelia]
MFIRSARYAFSSFPSPLVSVQYLKQNLNKVKVLDCSWYLPQMNRNAELEYKKSHIPGAIRFDIDANSLQETSLPHMLPKKEDFEKSVSDMGISNNDQIVVYDGLNIFTSARVYWQFKYFGHKDISVLDGGFPAWIKENCAISDAPPQIKKTKYKATPQPHMLRELDFILKNIENQNKGQKGDYVLDARPTTSFNGEVPELNPALPNGHMPYSTSLPFIQLIDQKTGLLKTAEEIKDILNSLNIDLNRNIICSCYQGVTAAIIYIALERIGLKNISLYDGSWIEYAFTKDVEIKKK